MCDGNALSLLILQAIWGCAGVFRVLYTPGFSTCGAGGGGWRMYSSRAAWWLKRIILWPEAFQFNCITSVPAKVSLHESPPSPPAPLYRSWLFLTSDPRVAELMGDVGGNEPLILLHMCRVQRSKISQLLAQIHVFKLKVYMVILVLIRFHGPGDQ